MTEFNKDNLKPGMIVKCKNELHYRVNFVDDTFVGLTFMYYEGDEFKPDEYCTYTDTPLDRVKEIVKDA